MSGLGWDSSEWLNAMGLIWGRQLSNLVTERIAQTKTFTEWRPYDSGFLGLILTLHIGCDPSPVSLFGNLLNYFPNLDLKD